MSVKTYEALKKSMVHKNFNENYFDQVKQNLKKLAFVQ